MENSYRQIICYIKFKDKNGKNKDVRRQMIWKENKKIFECRFMNLFQQEITVNYILAVENVPYPSFPIEFRGEVHLPESILKPLESMIITYPRRKGDDGHSESIEPPKPPGITLDFDPDLLLKDLNSNLVKA